MALHYTGGPKNLTLNPNAIRSQKHLHCAPQKLEIQDARNSVLSAVADSPVLLGFVLGFHLFHL